MPEAPVHSRVDWPNHFAWVRLGSADHAQAHDAAHSDYSRAYGNGHDEDATKGAHSHCTPPLVCAWCGGQAPQELGQWHSRCCPWCGEENDWPVDSRLSPAERNVGGTS